MFQFPGFPPYTYVFSIRYTALRRVCCHIRISADIMLICSSPRLIAACHVLLRLLMPRHSPYALFRLNFLSAPIARSHSCSLQNCLSFKTFRFSYYCSKRFSFCALFPPLLVKCSILPSIFRKDLSILCSSRNLISCLFPYYLFVSILIFFIRFSMNRFDLNQS